MVRVYSFSFQHHIAQNANQGNNSLLLDSMISDSINKEIERLNKDKMTPSDMEWGLKSLSPVFNEYSSVKSCVVALETQSRK